MKKILTLFTVLSSLLLSSCKVNIGEKNIDVHWLVIAIPVFIILLTAGLALGKIKYYCPNCNKTFYASWIKCIFSAHVDNERSMKCPHCKKTGRCYPSHNQENEK